MFRQITVAMALKKVSHWKTVCHLTNYNDYKRALLFLYRKWQFFLLPVNFYNRLHLTAILCTLSFYYIYKSESGIKIAVLVFILKSYPLVFLITVTDRDELLEAGEQFVKIHLWFWYKTHSNFRIFFYSEINSTFSQEQICFVFFFPFKNIPFVQNIIFLLRSMRTWWLVFTLSITCNDLLVVFSQ